MDEGVLEAARAIRWYLADLVGPAAEEVDRQLAEALAVTAGGGEDVEVRLRSLLNSYEGTRVFLEAVLEDAPEYRPPQVRPVFQRGLGYSPLPGEQGPIDADKFCCTYADYVWYRQGVGVPIPECDTHHVALVPCKPEPLD
jgi:hypothetical protein